MAALSLIDAGRAAADVGARARHIHGRGTPEAAWQAWPALGLLPALGLHELASADARLVIVAPHPDDEVLACGGLLAMACRAGREVRVVAVTDGEASHPGSIAWTRTALVRQRRQERTAGLRRLGLDAPCVRLGIADGAVAKAELQLERTLAGILLPGDAVFATWRFDGHPDHEAVGRASARAAAACDARCVEMPVWMWHWAAPADPAVDWPSLRRLELPRAAIEAKRAAIAAHASQLGAERAAGLSPVLPRWALARLLRPFESFFVGLETP